jgi:hypothetical protein
VEADVKTHELEVSMEAAAVLLSLAMHDTETPVAELGGALARMGGSLAELRKRAAAGAGADEAWRARLDNDLATCIESLQFHDRLIQQLAAVRNLLASVAHEKGTPNMTGFGARRWEDLLGMLRERLNVDSRHQLFDLLMRTGVVENDGRHGSEAHKANVEGSIELFD